MNIEGAKDKVDVLGREAIINQIIDIVKMLSENRSGCSFALEGRWGVGKSYLLNKLIKKLIGSEEGSYLVFNYNCWEYDYYEEPTVAIVSSIIDEVLQSQNKDIEKIVIDFAFGLEELAKEFLKGKISQIAGIDPDNISFKDHEKKEYDRKLSELDSFRSFRKLIIELRRKLEDLSKGRTLIFIVDEIDRCIPTYAIKVLERLHHIFYGLNNVIVILSVDRKQLEFSLKQIYGESIDIERYLRKFIDFRIELDEGTANKSLIENYNFYFDCFKDISQVIEVIGTLISYTKTDIRNLENIIDKLYIQHKLICKEDKCPSFILLFEMIIGIMRYNTEKDMVFRNNLYWISEIDKATYSGLSEYIGEETIKYLIKIKKHAMKGERIAQNNLYALVDNNDPVGCTFYYLDQLFAKNKSIMFKNTSPDSSKWVETCSQFIKLNLILI